MFMTYARRFLDNIRNVQKEHTDQDKRAHQPKADPEVEETSPDSFQDQDLAMVLWKDARTLGGAPWIEYCDELTDSPGFSVGLIYDVPRSGGVVVKPHLADFPPISHDDEERGAVFIPYVSILAICPLTIEDPLKPVSPLRRSVHMVPYVGTC